MLPLVFLPAFFLGLINQESYGSQFLDQSLEQKIYFCFLSH